MNRQMLKKLSAIALAVAMLQGVALTSAISYSAVETEQVEASAKYNFPIGTTVRYDRSLRKYVECEYKQCGDYTYYVTDDGKGAVIAGEQYVNRYYSDGGVETKCRRSGYQGTDKEVVIPSELDGLPVVKLDRYAFYYQMLDSVFVPGSVKTIGTYAFEWFNRGVDIQLSEGLEEIEGDAFSYNFYRELADLYAGKENRKLVIPSSVKKIKESAFGSNGTSNLYFKAIVFSKNSQLDRDYINSNSRHYDSFPPFPGKLSGDDPRYYEADVLVPDDFDVISVLVRGGKASYIYYTDKNKTMAEYANSDDAIEKERNLVKLEITDKNVSLKTNEEYELKSNLRQQSLIDCCTWQSSDTSVATVDENGKVTAVGVGTATITMTTENEMQASCTVNVSQNESDLAMTKPNLKIGLNQKYKLALNQTDVKGTWSSSDTSVATVNKSGNVTAVGVGTAMVTFTSEEGEKATCLINVAESKISDLGLSSRKSMKGLGRNYSLTPKDIRISGCTWKSSDTKVVTVNQYGIVKTVGVGTANVTVTDKFGNKFTCKVKVGI